MSENSSNTTVDDNVVKEKELLMGDNVHVGNDDNEVHVTPRNEELKEDRDKLVDINVNEIQDIENKSEKVPATDASKNDAALLNENSNEEENKDNENSVEKRVDDISSEVDLNQDQIPSYSSEKDDNSQAVQYVSEESKNTCDNEELSSNNENIQIEKTEMEKVSSSEELEKDLPSEKPSNEDVQDDISTEQPSIGDNPPSLNKESNQEINNSNLLNFTNEGVEDETLLIRGLAASEEDFRLNGQPQISAEENISSPNDIPSPTEEFSNTVTSTPLTTTLHQLIEDPIVGSQEMLTSEELINVESLAKDQYLSTTDVDKSLNTSAGELTAPQPEEPSSQLVEPLSSQTEEHLAPDSEELCATKSEDRAADLPQDLQERITSDEDRLDSTEKSNTNASQDNRFESPSLEDQEIRAEDQSSNAFSQNSAPNEDINKYTEESNSENSLIDVGEGSIPNDKQNQSALNQRELILDDMKIASDQESKNAADQVNEEEKEENIEEKPFSLEENLSQNTDLPVSDSVTEEILIPQETENFSTDKLTPCEEDEENIDSEKEFSRENSNDPEPVIEEMSKNQIELEESMPQSYETNECEDFVEIEERKLLASSPQEEIMDNLENEEKFECYEETENVPSHYSDMSANPDKKLNVESLQTRLTDPEQLDANNGVSENLLEYTEEVATNILQSSREEIARKSTTRSFWSREYQEFLKKKLSSLPSLIFFSFIFISGVLGSSLEMSVLPFALFNVVAFLSIFLIYKCFLSC
ncbi:unnamed protein product [Dimorphilus gyrociliatus]|uniref:Uncharacterized protein n=1 Tax=Dimorphilus gyrociliatus TaxID=2664684 RepID=A0A7I8VU56_9ANNE|nr:unnamed protein product [Dimorphilus gyrociliatus]